MCEGRTDIRTEMDKINCLHFWDGHNYIYPDSVKHIAISLATISFSITFLQMTETEGYTNDLKIDLKGYDRLYLFYYSIELIQI
jgi:hypothetical protein